MEEEQVLSILRCLCHGAHPPHNTRHPQIKTTAAASSSSSKTPSSSTNSNKAEGFVHEDTWALQLKNVPNGGQPFWERVARKGAVPSLRSGASMVGGI